MAASLYITKIILGGGAVVAAGTGGVIYLTPIKDQIWKKNELKFLDFLPWECRKEGNISCNLTGSDLSKIPFIFEDKVVSQSSITNAIATLKWEKFMEGVIPMDLEFTIKAEGSDSLEIKKDSNDTKKMTIGTEGSKFQLKEHNNKYFFVERKLSKEEDLLIDKVNGWDTQFTFEDSMPNNTTTATATDSAEKIKLSIEAKADSTSTPTKTSFELKVEFSNSTANQELVTGMKTWECIIKGEVNEANKEFFIDSANKTDQFSKLKKAFGLDGTTPTTLTQQNKKSINYFIAKCANLNENKDEMSEQKLSRIITKEVIPASDNTKFEFKNFEEFLTN